MAKSLLEGLAGDTVHLGLPAGNRVHPWLISNYLVDRLVGVTVRLGLGA